MNKIITFLLSTIKNGSAQYKKNITIPYSKNSLNLCDLLYKNGYITSFRHLNNKIDVSLKYLEKTPNIIKITLYSKPGRRLYLSCDQLLEKYSLQDFVIVSTKYGFLTIIDAYQMRVGGQIICKIN